MILHTLLKNDPISCTGYTENSGLLSYADLPNIHTFHSAIYKFVNIIDL